MVFQSDTTYFFFLALPRAVARFFVTRGIIARAEGTSLVGGSGRGVLPPEKVSNLEAPKSYFSTWREICLRKIDLEYENGKQLQVTIIKITESKENKTNPSTDLICLAQQVQGRQLPYGSVARLNWLGWSFFDIHIDWKLLIEGVVVSIILQRFLQQASAFRTPCILAADLYGQVQCIFKFITLVISSIALL